MSQEIIAHPNLPLLLAQAREEIISRFRPILNHFGVTEQQWRILRVLRTQEPLEPKQICETCLFLSPSLAGVLARMEEMGLVVKERVESDHRRVLVRMTPRSRALVDEALPLIAEQYRLLENVIGERQTAELYEVLQRLTVLRGADIPLVKLPAK
ncbi:homoprotocatechuate degradation operon regulator HpaR [Paramagnetospirillum marisnigri]|uniref:homoprotocatechuate degradation operon regulator HpaR n=1 Tax=Paramagnetospirillum marisnigri TaxID=1285242 RepID=UPI000838FFE0|nr:homoprotocatechuate degradation operon regulator HpaR [Paramagnetospirillum marisnigri]